MYNLKKWEIEIKIYSGGLVRVQTNDDYLIEEIVTGILETYNLEWADEDELWHYTVTQNY